MKKCLVLDTEPKNWPKSYDLFFLGYWCLEKIKDSFKKLKNFNIIDHEKDANNQKIDKYVNQYDQICKNLLDDISRELNVIHKKNFSKRFWTIIIGPWLKIFVGIVLERYTSLKFALEKKKFNKIILADYRYFNFYCENLSDFEDKISNYGNSWNLYLYTKIFEFLNFNIPVKKVKISNISTTFKKKQDQNFIKKILSKFLRIFMKKKDYFISDNPFSFLQNLKFYFFLNQIPQINTNPKYRTAKKNDLVRSRLKFKKKNVSDVEKFIREILPDILPTDSIENFSYLNKICDNLPWPKKPKLILSMYSYQQNEIFKLCAAKKIEKRARYVVAQHGGSYFTSKHVSFLPEIESCDKFISWGKIKDKKNVPLFNFRTDKNILSKKRSKIFFYSSWMHNMRARAFPEYKFNLNANISMAEIISGLNKKNKKSVIIRINKFNEKKLEKKIIREILFKKYKYQLDYFKYSKKEIFSRSKLTVHLTNSTGFLETMAANVPSVLILPNLNWVQNSAKEDFNKLKEAKILFFKTKLLTNHINENIDNISNWWNDKKVIRARNSFIKKYSLPLSKNPELKFANLLKKLA